MLPAKSSPSSQVNIIPATRRHIRNGSRIDSHYPLRVAAYCRVSTEEKSQENSYAAQKSHYTLLIQSKPDWELAGINPTFWICRSGIWNFNTSSSSGSRKSQKIPPGSSWGRKIIFTDMQITKSRRPPMHRIRQISFSTEPTV